MNFRLFFSVSIVFLFNLESGAQNNIVDYTFTFLDKNGSWAGYEVQFTFDSSQTINEKQKQELLNDTKKVALDYGRKLSITNFVFKRDSVEKQFVTDLRIQAKKKNVLLEEIRIINLLLPKQIFDDLIKRQELTGESLTGRIKPH